MGRGLSSLEKMILIIGYEREGDLGNDGGYLSRNQLKIELVKRGDLRKWNSRSLAVSVCRSISRLQKRGLMLSGYSLTPEGMVLGREFGNCNG
jgi:hypothetical protein